MDHLKELLDLIEKAGLKPCLWFGLPDCPKCGQGHGDPACSEEDDFALRVICYELSPYGTKW